MALQKLNAQTLEGDLDVVDITASGDITLTSTASFKIPSGTTAQRGTSTTGALRFNSQTSEFEGYNGTEWGTIGGGGLTDADEDTYITAEATADSDDLDFWTAGTKRMTIDQAGLITVGVDDTGYDVKFFGATTGKYMLWDQSEDTLVINGDVGIGTGNPVSALTIAGATSNLSTFTEDLTVAANYSMAVIGPVTIPNVTVNGNLNIMTELNVTGDIDTGANGSFNIIG